MSSIRRALISVSDKSELNQIAEKLSEYNIEIISTGGTAEAVRGLGIAVTDVSSVTSFPEILDGRVKTLHPLIHGGILADRTKTSHLQEMNTFSIDPIDLVVVNLYPFRKTLENLPHRNDEIIENIDIGGPCLIRAAAKNFKNCLVITEPGDYQIICDLLENRIEDTDELRKKLAYKAFRHTCKYDYFIQSWLDSQLGDAPLDLPDETLCLLTKDETLRYGENPHQDAAIYRIPDKKKDGLLGYTQLGGKPLSFNNMLDLSAAWDMAMAFHEPAAIVVKHQNPCGASVGETLSVAYEKALAGDPMSAFGGIVALNRTIDLETAQKLHSTNFLEVIAAPDFTPDALEKMKKKKNRRLVKINAAATRDRRLDIRMFHNGALIQTRDQSTEQPAEFHVVTGIQPTEDQWKDLVFAWNICRYVKSNAIVMAKNQAILGVGAGQMSRVDSVKIAAMKAGNRMAGGVMASDAFFPFADGVEAAAAAGVTAVIQPGGSKGDESVIEACNRLGITMVFTGVRHFKH